MNARVPFLLAAALVLGRSPLGSARIALAAEAEAPEAPAWSGDELKGLFNRIQQSGRAQRPQEKDAELVSVAGLAYRVERQGAESTDFYAKRVLKARVPTHPAVKAGQWLTALMSTFYADVAARCSLLARFEKSRQDRAYFDQMGKEAKGIAAVLAKEVQVSFDGAAGFTAPLPVAATCADPVPHGASVTVRGGKVSIENIERADFKNDVAPEDAPRTGTGAMREFYAAQRQYNVSAEMLGNYDADWRRNKGLVRVSIPGASPAVYLNEIVRGSIEAGMHTLVILAVDSKNALCQVQVPIAPPKPPKRGKAPKKTAAQAKVVHCADDAPMQKCLEHLVLEQKEGPVRFEP